MSVLCGHPAVGTATIFYGTTGRHYRYTCDAIGHRILVTDEEGELVRGFGGFGRRAGQLDTPLDLVFVRPEFAGERLPVDSPDATWLAVADYGNRRVQVFEVDGALVGEAVLDAPDGGRWTPTRLTWHSPLLQVEGIEGARLSVHLSAALLAGVSRTPQRTRPVFVSGARH